MLCRTCRGRLYPMADFRFSLSDTPPMMSHRALKTIPKKSRFQFQASEKGPQQAGPPVKTICGRSSQQPALRSVPNPQPATINIYIHTFIHIYIYIDPLKSVNTYFPYGTLACRPKLFPNQEFRNFNSNSYGRTSPLNLWTSQSKYCRLFGLQKNVDCSFILLYSS